MFGEDGECGQGGTYRAVREPQYDRNTITLPARDLAGCGATEGARRGESDSDHLPCGRALSENEANERIWTDIAEAPGNETVRAASHLCADPRMANPAI